MKKFICSAIAFIAAVIMCFGASSCGKGGQSDGESTSKPAESVSSSEKEKITITLNETKHNAVEDDIFTLIATVTPARSVRWSSSDDKIAAVSASGRVIAKKAGTAVIIADADGEKATCEVVVSAAEKSEYYVLTDKSAYLTALSAENKKTITVKSYFSDENGERELTGEKFTFETLDEKIATVSENGEITPVSLGTTEIIVSGEHANASVTVDVYTAAITTPYEWLDMFKNDENHDERYYLENDIDFVGVTYDFGRDFPIFSAEVNGNYHTVKNITEWRDKRYSDSSRDAFQSVFGADVFGMRLKNISLKNIRFTKSYCAVIGDSMRMHPGNYTWGDPLYETKISNVNIEAIYEAGGTGLIVTLYGGSMENVFAYLRKSDGSAFGTELTGIVKEDYLNWQLGTSEFSNVIVYAEGGTVWDKNQSSIGISLKNSFISTTRQDALYRAFATFNKNVWKLSEKDLPKLKGDL